MFRKMMCSAALAAALAMTTGGWAAAETRYETIQFPAGQSSYSVFGTVGGYDTVEYGLNATKGQRLRVTMKTSNTSAYFSVYAPGDTPGKADALFTGATTGSYADLTLPADGRYTIQTYLMRNAAQTNGRADYTLDIHISDGGADTATQTPGGEGPGATTPPLATPTAAPAGGRQDWRVAGIDNMLNIRKSPSTNAPVVATVGNGAILQNGGCETAEGRQWCRVTTTDGNQISGWTVGYYLVRSDAPITRETDDTPSAPEQTPTDDATRMAPKPGAMIRSTPPRPRPAKARTGTTARGNLPCSVRLGMLTRDCAYQASRAADGTTLVSIGKPGGKDRQIRFQDGRPVSRDGMTVEKRGDITVINIGDERYEIPANVVLGR